MSTEDNNNVPVNDKTVESMTADTILQSISENTKKMEDLVKENKKLQVELVKALKKERKTLSKSGKSQKKEIKQVPQKVTPEMQKFIEKNFADEASKEGTYTRQHLMRLLSSYIKKQNIQNPENKKQWSGKEKTLKKLFKLDQEWYTFMQVNGILSSIIVKAQ